MKHSTLHYKQQRDTLIRFLLEELGMSKTKVANILGITPQAIIIQFPTGGKK